MTGWSCNITFRAKLYCYSTCACYSGLLLHQMEGRWQTQKGNWIVLFVLLLLSQLSLHSFLTKHRVLEWLPYKMKKCFSVAAISRQKAEIGALHFGSSFRITVRYILFFLPALNFGVLRTQFWIRIGECEVLYAERTQRSDSWYLHVWGPFLETWPDSTSARSTAVTVNERVVKGEDVLPSRVEFLSSHPHCSVYTVQKSRNATTYTRLLIRMII